MNVSPSSSVRPALIEGMRIRIAKGCRAREVSKGAQAIVVSVEALGANHSHMARVTLKLGGDRVLNFYARHANRLTDPVVRLNDGNPLHVIEVRRV